MRHPTVTLLTAAALLAGCGDDPLTVADVTGDYTLARAAGVPVPATVRQTEAERTDVVGGTLRLEGSARYLMVVTLQTVSADENAVPLETRFEDAGSYQIGDGVILLVSDVPEQAWAGTASGSGVTLTVMLPGLDEIDLAFRR